MALAGGVNIMSSIHNYMDLGKAGFLSPTGQCKPFDENADGYCRAEGAGLVVLKLLKDAISEGDQILGVIPGVATNQGGLSPSITIPSSSAQIQLYKNILSQAQMRSDQVNYVEAHGTGTQAGDPVEVASIREVFGGPQRSNPLHIGSIKGNIGHCETAAGVAGLIKVLAMINKGSIPPLTSFKKLNPKIPALQADGMCIDLDLKPWDAPLRTACVSSYGAAGSNAALLCCEYPRQSQENQKEVPLSSGTYPIMLSAASKESLVKYSEIMAAFLRSKDRKPQLANLAFTLSERRKHHRFRWVTTATGTSDILRGLDCGIKNSIIEVPKQSRRLVLIFSGQCKQNIGLDKNFFNSNHRLQYYILKCDDLLTKTLGLPSIIPGIFQSEPLDDIVVLQCGTFALQYACARCWIDAGLHVDMTIGHSFGELTALVVSKVLSLEDGLKLMGRRASLMQSKWGPERGKMLAVHCDRNTAAALLKIANKSSLDDVEIACYNSPSSQVIVGSESSIARVEALLTGDRTLGTIRNQRLRVSHGFHSKFTEPLLKDIEEVSKSLVFGNAEIPLETCTLEEIKRIDPLHISNHTRNPVYFTDAVQRIEKKFGHCIFLEAGIGSSIIPMAKRAVVQQERHNFQGLEVGDEQQPDAIIASVVANLWREGISVSPWTLISPLESGHSQIWLPPYQFQHTSHWVKYVDRVIEAQNDPTIRDAEKRVECRDQQPEMQRMLVNIRQESTCSSASKIFTVDNTISRFTQIISGHRVVTKPLCPASLYMECVAMALEQSQEDVTSNSLFYEDLAFLAPLGHDLTRDVRLSLEAGNEPNLWSFSITSSPRNNPKSRATLHCQGRVGLIGKPKFDTYQRLISGYVKSIEDKKRIETLMSNRAYALFSRVVSYSDFFMGISNISLERSQAVAEIEMPPIRADSDGSTVVSICDAVPIDMFIQVLGLIINSSDRCTSDKVFVCTGIGALKLSVGVNFETRTSWTVYTSFTPVSDDEVIGDVFVMTREGVLVVAITSVDFSRLKITSLIKVLGGATAEPVSRSTASSGARHSARAKPELLKKAPKPILDDVPHSDSYSNPCESTEMPENSSERVKLLQSMVLSYTGLAIKDIDEDISLMELGTDSLAAAEMSNEIQSTFSVDIMPDDLLSQTYSSLSRLVCPRDGLGVSAQALPSMNHQNEDVSVSSSSDIPSRPGTDTIYTPPKDSRDSSERAGSEDGFVSQREKVLQIVSEASGAGVSVIQGNQTLNDLGIDSLSAIEVKGDLEDAFSIEFNNGDISPDSTVDQVLKCLGIQQKKTAVQPVSSPAVSTVQSPKSYRHSQSSEIARVMDNDPETPAVLGSPLQAIALCEESFGSYADSCGFTNYWNVVAPMQNELVVAYISEAFQTLGVDLWQLEDGQVLPRVDHLPKHSKLMARLLEILEKHHIISRGADPVRTSKRLSTQSSTNILNSFMSKFIDYRCEANLMALTGSKLAGCLTGVEDPMVLLFGRLDSQKILEDFYTRSPMLATLTEQLVEVIQRVISNNDSSTVRIIEVGAGFGGTTSRLAQALQATGRRIEYTFTDIAPRLVRSAATKFADYPWMDFKLFNLEHDVPASMEGKYDIAIGTNCVHATADKTASVENIGRLLNRDGFLVLSEVTKIVDWYDIVYGLLDGWWLDKSGSYPLAPAATWMHYFKQAGFRTSSHTKGPSQESLTQQLLLASKQELVPLPSRAAVSTPVSAAKTVVYKEVGGVEIHADIYLPPTPPDLDMPIGRQSNSGSIAES